jgi:hypothetical protein
MVFLSFNVCNPVFYSANDQNQNLKKARLFKTLIQNCSCLDAHKIFHNSALKNGSKNFILLFVSQMCFQKMDSNIPFLNDSVWYFCLLMFAMFLNFFVMAQILKLNKTRLFKTFNQNCSCLEDLIKPLSTTLYKNGSNHATSIFCSKSSYMQNLKTR